MTSPAAVQPDDVRRVRRLAQVLQTLTPGLSPDEALAKAAHQYARVVVSIRLCGGLRVGDGWLLCSDPTAPFAEETTWSFVRPVPAPAPAPAPAPEPVPALSSTPAPVPVPDPPKEAQHDDTP